MSVSDPRRLRACVPLVLVLVLALALVACGKGGEGEAAPVADPATASSAGAGTTPQGAGAATDAPGTAQGITAGKAEPGFGERQLDHPDDLQMLMLVYRLEGREPPIAEWAAAQPGVAYADEFKRPALLEEERQRLQGIYDATAGVGRLRMNVNARFGEYDASRGGYYLDAFMPGSQFNFSVRPAPSKPTQQIALQVDNPEELNFWPMDAAAAKDVLERNQGLREVTLDSRFRITGISRRGDGPVISARLSGYAIGSDHFRNPVTFGDRSFDTPAQENR